MVESELGRRRRKKVGCVREQNEKCFLTLLLTVLLVEFDVVVVVVTSRCHVVCYFLSHISSGRGGFFRRSEALLLHARTGLRASSGGFSLLFRFASTFRLTIIQVSPPARKVP